ncbi:helix-turn-helix domain-containing protein [Desulfofundulus thermosubterraneus]|uniref:DNA-binding transcriptional regulator, XRE-family HTH domain n=1 Tax=Desulfofundulus thermosubterraneus DSM 16057 TaxID=1121432 RepID=A0A1M6F0H2_9FIRM|nr:helix-turn-helix transcriptional regulator [Desulfofundulus thermosubterraneus]SHI91234.1 DNA-binding transcriptional regulator, XRE-family HTH domain [Desulfofundulus thermosubterraneus DSM 16057]
MSRLPSFSEIGERIRILREQCNMSQEELASRIGLSRPVVTKIEGGKKALNSLELRLIADALSVSTDDLTRPVEEEDCTLVGRFRAKQDKNNPALIESIEKLDRIFEEVLGQIRLWRTGNG